MLALARRPFPTPATAPQGQQREKVFEMTTNSTCQERIYQGGRDVSGHTCGRTFKTDEQKEAQLCGIHLGGLKRRRANQAKWKAEQAAKDAVHKKAQALCDRLAEFDVKAQPEYAISFRLAEEATPGR